MTEDFIRRKLPLDYPVMMEKLGKKANIDIIGVILFLIKC